MPPFGRKQRGASAAVVLGSLGVLLLLGLASGLSFPKAVAAGLPSKRSQLSFGGRQLTGISLPTFNPQFVTEGEDLVIQEYCEPAHAHEMANKFISLTKEDQYWTACGETKWIDELHKLSPKGSKTFMDVGCNKGYTSAKFFGLWAPEVGFNPQAITARRPEVWCGNCGDCQEKVQPVFKKSKDSVTVYCFEPSQANFAQLILTRDAFFKQNDPDVQWFTINQAMSNATGSARFSRECTSEQCSLDAKAKRNYDLITTTTVDAFLHEQGIQHVDALKIDTEGFDAAVITGAMESIAKGRVGIISFEYHEVGVWREYSLRQTVQWLTGFNYVCYYEGKPTLTRLTGCWDDLYEMYAWSNVVCVPRSHPLYPRMERMSMRYMQYQAQYYHSTTAR